MGETPDSDPSSTQAEKIVSSDPYVVQHRPRTKAKPPMWTPKEAEKELGPPQLTPERAQQVAGTSPIRLSREQVDKAYDLLEERRIGPYAVKYGCYASAGVIAYTYLNGFYHLAQKNRAAWQNTFRHRMFILGPVIGMYAAAHNVLPMPFRERLEALLGRQSITLFDIVTARKTVQAAKEHPEYRYQPAAAAAAAPP